MKIYILEYYYSIMKYKIHYKDFLKTFSDEQNKEIEDYNKVMKLHEKSYSRGEIKRKVNVSIDKLHQWRNTEMKPISVKILNKAKKRGYFKPIAKNKIEWLAYLIGYNLGDGNVSRNLCNTWFYGVNSDLAEISKLLLKFNVKPVIYTYKINNGKMAVHDHVFSRFLVCFGAVIGDKTMAKVKVPKWILNSKKKSKLKLRFLQGFFDSELSNVKLIKNKPLACQALKLYTSKHKDCINEGIFFLKQIRSLLKEFNVVSSEVKFDRTYLRGRDKSTMQQLYLVIYSNYINLCNFIKNIGFLHNFKRRRESIRVLSKIESKAVAELNKIKQYRKALELRQGGLSAYKIAEKLNLKIGDVKYWIYKGGKPVLYNFVKRN